MHGTQVQDMALTTEAVDDQTPACTQTQSVQTALTMATVER